MYLKVLDRQEDIFTFPRSNRKTRPTSCATYPQSFVRKIKLKVGHVNFPFSIYCFSLNGGSGAYPGSSWGTTWTCVQFITGRMLTLSLTLLFTLTPKINWESPIHRACMSLDCGRRQTNAAQDYIHSCAHTERYWTQSGTHRYPATVT